jgi:ribosomal protein S18 acetylase RimI-like enzyme
MNRIVKATTKEAKYLAKIAAETFLVSHGKSASKVDIENYVYQNFSEQIFHRELSNPKLEYYLIYHKNSLAGFSKVVFNVQNQNIKPNNCTKMERLYLLKAYHGLQLGKELLEFNIQLAKENNQTGIWLYVWVQNHRAISFYTKMGFVNVGKFDFVISATHTNPNHVLYLEF